MDYEQRLLRSAIAGLLPRPLLKGLHSRSGEGAFSSATFMKLQAAGLCDARYNWTDKGHVLRRALGIEPYSPTPTKEMGE